MRRGALRTVLAVTAAVVLVAPPSTPALAQEGEGALYKSDLVRLLTGRAHTQEEIADLVRRRCLGFEPTDRDLRNFRMLGAGAGVLEAIRECGEPSAPPPAVPPPPSPSPDTPSPRSEGTRPAAPGGARPAAGGSETELTLFVSPRRADVRPGEELEITAEVTAGAAPVSRVLLALREGETEGEEGLVTMTRTDARGRAVFRVAAGPAGVRRYSVEGVGREVRGAGEIVVEVSEADAATPAPPEDRRPAAAEEGGAGAGEPSRAGAGAGGAGADRVGGEGDPPPGIPVSLLEVPERALEEAERLSRAGQYGEADRLYRATIRRHPESVEARVGYAYHLARIGRHDEAEARLREIPSGEEDRPDVQKARGFLSLWTGEPEEAVRRFRRATALDPDDPEAWRGLGRALSELGREEEAREAFRRSAEVGPGDRPRDAGSARGTALGTRDERARDSFRLSSGFEGSGSPLLRGQALFIRSLGRSPGPPEVGGARAVV